MDSEDQLPAPDWYSLTDHPNENHRYDLSLSWTNINAELATALIKVLVRHEVPVSGPRY